MADYRILAPLVLKHEGGKSGHLNDRALRDPDTKAFFDRYGYHTNRGVTWKTFVGLAARAGYTATEPLFSAMPLATWTAIFKLGFWDSVLGDRILHQGVANQLADFAWGSGPVNAVTVLQQVLNKQFGQTLAVDGGMGPLTLAATNRVNGEQLALTLYNARLAFLRRVPDSEDFIRGWTRRVQEVFELAKKNGTGSPSPSSSRGSGTSPKGGARE